MRAVLTYAMRTILLIAGLMSFCVLMGEPMSNEIDWLNFLVWKGLSALGVVICIKAYLLTLSDKERKEIENERV